MRGIVILGILNTPLQTNKMLWWNFVETRLNIRNEKEFRLQEKVMRTMGETAHVKQRKGWGAEHTSM